MKGLYANRSPLYQTGVLFTLILTGFAISSCLIFCVVLVKSMISGKLEVDLLDQSVGLLQITQFVSAILMFLLPALCTAWLCSKHPKDFLSIRAYPDSRLLIIICITTLLLSPTVSLTGYFNAKIQLPSSMEAIETWMKSSEDRAYLLIQQMIAAKGVFMFVLNLIVIAVTAAVTEEFLFRGALQPIIQRKIQNHHLTIWIVAAIFSAIHFQFYGFIPRLILGSYLGYLLYWTKNIWVPVFAHFFHNAVAFIGMSDASLKDHPFFSDDISPDDIRWLSITAGVCLLLFFVLLRLLFRSKFGRMPDTV